MSPRLGNGTRLQTAASPGYYSEVFKAMGETIAVLVVPESDLQPLRADEVLNVRELIST